jgi:hypothetical protein
MTDNKCKQQSSLFLSTALRDEKLVGTMPAQSDLDYWNNCLATLDDQCRHDLLADPTFTNGG